MKSVCFTGHRKLNKQDIDLGIRLYERLKYFIVNYGVTDFYAGGAIGWDTLAELTVLKLREIYPDIRLHLVLPCSNEQQTKKWSPYNKKIFYNILSRADSVEYVSINYTYDCMKLRNQRLIRYADICFCYFIPTNNRSGTFQTINFAMQKRIPIINMANQF